MSEKIGFCLPDWVAAFEDERRDLLFATDEARMAVAIALAARNVELRTGGPFGAALFEPQTGRLVAVGVNLVEGSGLSLAHAEMVAIAVAQMRAGSYDLGRWAGGPLELVSSAEPCAMCMGAIPWSGIGRVVVGARDPDVRLAGFDEGDKPPHWVSRYRERGIAVARDVGRAEALAVLRRYAMEGGAIYGPAPHGREAHGYTDYPSLKS